MTISSLYVVEKEHLVLSVSKKTFWILQYWLKRKITCDEHCEHVVVTGFVFCS